MKSPFSNDAGFTMKFSEEISFERKERQVIDISPEEREKFLKGLKSIHESNLDHNGYRHKLNVKKDSGSTKEYVVCKLDPPKYQLAMLRSGRLVRRSREDYQVYELISDPTMLTQEEFNAVMLLAKAARIKTSEEFTQHASHQNH